MNESNSLTKLFDQANSCTSEHVIDRLHSNINSGLGQCFNNGNSEADCWQARSKSATNDTTPAQTTSSLLIGIPKKRPAPSSAPITRSSKYDELSPWAFSFTQASERSMAAQKSKQMAANGKGVATTAGGLKSKLNLPSFYSSQKFKNSKFQQRCSWLPTADAAFQHHTDLSKYMSEYRSEKLQRMKEEISRDEAVIAAENEKHSEDLAVVLQNMCNHEQNQAQANRLREKTELLHTLQKLNKFELAPNKKMTESVTKVEASQANTSQKIVQAVLNDSPMKVRGGKVYQERATFSDEKTHRRVPPQSHLQMSHSTTHFNPITNRYEPTFPLTSSTMTTCHPTVHSGPATSTIRYDMSTNTVTVPRKSFLSDDILQCRKLMESHPNGSTTRNTKFSKSPISCNQWKSPIKKSHMGRVAHGVSRNVPALQASGIRYSDYDQIIKRLVDQNNMTNQTSGPVRPTRIR